MAGTPAVGGPSGVDNFIPEVWCDRILKHLETSLVYGSCVNTDYEGDIKNQGDTVRINSVGDVTITPGYVKNAPLPDIEFLDSDQQILLIDQGDVFRFGVDDIEAAQSNANVMDEAMQRAGYGFKKTIDSYLAGHYVDVAAVNKIGSDASPIALATEAAAGVHVYDYLVDLGVLLDESDTPEQDRWAILPPFMVGLIEKDERFVKNGISTEVLTNGFAGTAAGFKVYKSNQVHKTAGETRAADIYHVMAGHKMAISFANQITKIEAYRPEDYFMDAVKGVQIYGSKTVRKEQFAVLTCTR